MPLDRAAVQRIAMLARIEVPETELDRLAGELSHFLGWMEQLGEVDTSEAEPLRSVMAIPPRRRPDRVADGDRQADILKNAPLAHDGYFVVPKVVE